MDTKKILFRNTITSFLSQFLLIGLGIITMPYVVHKLGDSQYGIISIVMVFIGYLSFLDLGIGWAIVKFVAEYHSQNNKERIKQVIQTSVSIFLIGGLSVIIIVFLTAEYLVINVFNIPENLHEVSIIAFKIASVGFLVNMLSSIYGSVLNGYQRFDITNLIRTIYGLFNILGTVFLLYQGFGLLHVIILNFIGTILNFILVFAFARWLDNSVSLIPVFTKGIFKKVISFSLWTTASKIGLQMIYNLEKAFVGYFLPIEMMTYYIIPFNIASKLTVVCSTIGSVIYPAFSSFEAIKEDKMIRNLFLRAQKYIFFGVYPIVFVLIFFAEDLLKYWIGNEYAVKGAIPLRILSLAFLINSISSEDAILFDGIGKPRISAVIVSISGIANVPLAYLFVKFLGIHGASIALLLSVIIYSLSLMSSTERILSIGILERVKKIYILPIVISLTALPLCYYSTRFIKGFPSLLIVISAGLILLYLLMIFACFSRAEREELIHNTIGFIKS